MLHFVKVPAENRAFVQCKNDNCVLTEALYLSAATCHGVDADAPRGRCCFAIQIWESPRMTEHSLWRFSRALHRAINERQLEEIAGLLDDEVEWAIYGPIDLFPFFGSRRGKAAVLEVIRQIADNLRVRRFDREQIMLGADSASSDVALIADRARFEQADFVAGCAFRPVQGSGLLTSFRVLVDTFDLVEQTVGYPIHLPPMAVAR